VLGNVQGSLGVLFNQQDGGAGFVELLDDRKYFSHNKRRKTHGGLV
jgi:hypothetical protein